MRKPVFSLLVKKNKKELKKEVVFMSSKAQVSFEYIMVVGIAMLIIVPGALLFQQYSLKSNDELTRSRIELVGNEIVDSAEKVYYIGENSWETLKLEIPNSVKSMYVLNYYEFVIEYETHTGLSEAVFFSDINLTTPLGYGGNISDSFHTGLNKIKISSEGSYILINETR